jgi:hypothetical protein
MYLTGEFLDRASLIHALRAIKDFGLSSKDIAVYSSEPLELPHSALARGSHMSLAVVTGAMSFGLLVVGSVYYAQHSYPIITGGMPIFSFWATGVVFYELTMLGAILSSLIWFLRESGLLTRRLPAPVYQPGFLCLRVHCAPDQEEILQRLLEKAGGADLRVENISQ